MPFRSNHNPPSLSSSSSSHNNAQHPSHTGTVAGIFQASQTLGSIGAPANLRTATTPSSPTQPTTSAGTDLFLDSTTTSSSSRATGSMAGSNPASTPNYGLPSHPASGMTPQQRPPQYARNPQDELHMQRPPRMALEHATPGHPTTTAPLQSPMDTYAAASRPPAINASHSYSRSSPAAAYDSYQGGMNSDQSQQNLASPTKYTPVSQRNVSSTPLGLADIRPRADSNISETGLPGANPYSYDGASAMPTNSNYLAPWAIYAFDWCKWPAQNGDAGKVAVGSYLEDGHNFIQILESQITPSLGDSYTPGAPKYGLDFVKIAEATHSYPVTRLLWEPPSSQKQSTDLLATSGDHLRLWSLPSDTPMASPGNSINRSSNNHRELAPSKLTPLALLSNSKTPEHTAPLTSLDWNTVSPSLIITSSIDTTCTIWDIPTLTAKTQLIAHDKEVFDVRFCANSVDVFVSCGADGSVRMFDLRSLEHSTIIYEPTAKDDKDGSPGGRMSPTLAQQTMSYAPPLLRLAASPHDQHLLATFSQDSNIIRILDVRQPGQALLELRGHSSSINCIEWSPTRRGTLASGADDSLVLIWDLLSQSTAAAPNPGANSGSDNSRGPTASWRCDYEVGNISWAPHSALSNDGGDWLGVSGGRGIWGVKL